MSKRLFNDLDEKQYTQERDAAERRAYLKLVRETVAGGEDEATREAARLTQDFVDVTDGASLVISYLKMPGPMRDGIDAVIGATGGETDFIEITDEVLAERMGKSTKSVQRWRDEFRKWTDHGALIQIKDNWQHPETGESHAHAYKCNITALAVEAALEARLDAGYASDPDRRRKALQDAAEAVAASAPCFPPRKVKKRRTRSDAEVLRSNLQSATKSLEKATALRAMVRNPDFEELYALRQQLTAQLAAFDEAYGLDPMSMHNTDKEYVDTAPPDLPDASASSPCMDIVNETEINTQVDKMSTCNDSIESMTCEKVVICESVVEYLCQSCLRVVPAPVCPCDGAACPCAACRESIRRLRAHTWDVKRLGLHKDSPPFSYWSESDGAAFDVVARVGASDEEAKRIWRGYEARLTRGKGASREL